MIVGSSKISLEMAMGEHTLGMAMGEHMGEMGR